MVDRHENMAFSYFKGLEWFEVTEAGHRPACHARHKRAGERRYAQIILPNLARISHEEHQTEWKNNTILINYTLIYLKLGIADCNSAKYKKGV